MWSNDIVEGFRAGGEGHLEGPACGRRRRRHFLEGAHVVRGSGVRSEGAIGRCLVSRDTIRTCAHMYSVDRNHILESLEWHCSNAGGEVGPWSLSRC